MQITDLPSDEVDRLEPLWVGVHRHHQTVAPQLAPYVDDATTWRVRRAVYEKALAAGGFALLARDQGRDVGYALVRVTRASWPATFVMGPFVAELESLAVEPSRRGVGIGTRLLDEVDARLDASALCDRLIGVVSGNEGAISLYRRRGYTPTWLTVSRFGYNNASGTSTSPAVESVRPDQVDALKPLWLELHHHRQAVAPHLAPFVDDASSWRVVHPQLVRAAAAEILLRAGDAGAPIAFAWASIQHENPTWSDTWQVGRDIAETHMIIVSNRARGRGLGTSLLDTIDHALAERGVRDHVIGAIEPNTNALRLYARRGFRPAWLELTRNAARDKNQPTSTPEPPTLGG